MGLRIATNTPSLIAQRNLQDKTEQSNRSIARLSSGNRIVSAADDSAGLAIAQNLQTESRSLQQAQRNASDAVSIAQTAEGSLNEVSNILVRLRELSVQAASDTIGDGERSMVAKEFNSLKSEVDRISQTTNFNGRQLLDGSSGTLDFQVGSKNGENNRISLNTNDIKSSASALGIGGAGVDSKGDASSSMDSIDQAINQVNGYRASLGSLQNRLSSASNNLSNQVEAVADAHSRIADTDVAEESSKLTRSTIQQNAAMAVLAQANKSPSDALKLL